MQMHREGSRPRTMNLLPNYFFSFDPPPGSQINIKNDLVLGIPELKERNIKVVEKNDFTEEIRLLNAIISKQNTGDTYICIEYLNEDANEDRMFECHPENIVKLKHRDFLLCQEVAAAKLDRELRLEILNNADCEIMHWPVVILNNVSQRTKSDDLLTTLFHTITDNFACINDTADIINAVRGPANEEFVLVLYCRMNF